MKLWSRLLGESSTEKANTAWTPLRIVSRGMCCAVGHNAPAATAAINARMNHFRETSFFYRGAPLMGATLYDIDVWSAARCRAMFDSVLRECLIKTSDDQSSEIMLIVLTAEKGRPGADKYWHEKLMEDIYTGSTTFHSYSQVLESGKAGIADALNLANAAFSTAKPPKYVAIVAVDSYLTATSISHYLNSERIKTTDNSDGFMPGEAAAGILLSPESSQHHALWIEGAATALEPAPYGSEDPFRAVGLVKAMRDAAIVANCEIAALDFQLSGVTGEAWYFREEALAIGQAIERRVAQFPHIPITRSTGEIGAASPVISLAWLSGVMGKPNSPGKSALLHFGNDDGARSALVVKHRK